MDNQQRNIYLANTKNDDTHETAVRLGSTANEDLELRTRFAMLQGATADGIAFQPPGYVYGPEDMDAWIATCPSAPVDDASYPSTISESRAAAWTSATADVSSSSLSPEMMAHHMNAPLYQSSSLTQCMPAFQAAEAHVPGPRAPLERQPAPMSQARPSVTVPRQRRAAGPTDEERIRRLDSNKAAAAKSRARKAVAREEAQEHARTLLARLEQSELQRNSLQMEVAILERHWQEMLARR